MEKEDKRTTLVEIRGCQKKEGMRISIISRLPLFLLSTMDLRGQKNVKVNTAWGFRFAIMSAGTSENRASGVSYVK